MSQNLSANTPIKFSLKLVEILYNETIYTKVTNTNYEGEIKNEGDRVRVRTLGKITLNPYTKQMDLVAEDLTPTFEELIIDQKYYFKFEVDSIDQLQNDIATATEYAKNAKEGMEELLDTDILTYMSKNVHFDNAIGTAYSTGTVAVDAAGAVTGSGTTFTPAMVGGYFKATGHTKAFIVATRTSNTAITLVNQDGTPYDGGVIAGGTAYVINAATAVAVTQTNIYSKIVELRTALGKKLTPKAGRFLIVNSEFEGVLLQSPQFIPAVTPAYEDAVKGAKIGRIGGFDVFCSELVVGDNTNGFWFIAGTKDYCAMALQIMKVNTISSSTDPNKFVDTCKGLLVWGRKVFDNNRGRGAVLRATLSIA